MSNLQKLTRSIDIGEGWSQDRSLGDDTQNAIRQASSIDLESVFRHYNIILNKHIKSICCPFPFHQDKNPSFNYYPETNSFYCFGCKNSGGPVNFISLLRKISKYDSASYLLNSFESEEVDDSIFFKSKEREELHLRFSKIIRNFLSENKNYQGLVMADNISFVFDEANRKHKMDIEGLKMVIDRLEKLLLKYQG